MAIPAVFPIAGKGMIAVLWVQWLFVRQGLDHNGQITFKCLAMWSFGFRLVISPKRVRTFNRPHSSPLTLVNDFNSPPRASFIDSMVVALGTKSSKGSNFSRNASHHDTKGVVNQRAVARLSAAVRGESHLGKGQDLTPFFSSGGRILFHRVDWRLFRLDCLLGLFDRQSIRHSQLRQHSTG